MVNKFTLPLPISSLIFFFSNLGSPEPEKAIQEEGITEDAGENEDDQDDDEGRTVYPYERLTTTAEDPVAGIDVTKREVSHWIVRFSSRYLIGLLTMGYSCEMIM